MPGGLAKKHRRRIQNPDHGILTASFLEDCGRILKINVRGSGRESMKKKRYGLEFCLMAVLLLFSLRHAAWGLDLWDTGYNYANYTYASPDHLGTMWWFSTYLTNLVGHLFTLLPFGDTLIGLNVYTGLFVGGISVIGYLFCTRRLGISRVCAFAGEMTALCLCWCPSAKLYDYLTYLFFLLCVIFLYEGLTGRKAVFLVLAGACLGTNIFVRFSNLPEAGLIVAVWGYALLEGLEKRERFQRSGRSWLGFAFARAGGYTLWCLAGYLIPLFVGFGWIAVRYGLGEYAQGIRLLFAMTDSAAGYQAGSMLYGIIWPFWEGKYWMIRILLFVIAAGLAVLFIDHISLWLKGGKRAQRLCGGLEDILTAGAAAALIYWLYTKREPYFYSAYYKSYDAIYWPAVIFLTLALCICAVQIFRRHSTKQEKLLAGLILLVIPITSLGSNNGLYPSFNNLFLAAPYVFREMVCFTRWAYERNIKKAEMKTVFWWDFRPAAFAGWALLAMFLIQFGLFGIRFAFCEGTGVQERGYAVNNNRVLKGVEMSFERAEWISGISGFADQNGLAGQEVILYGWIPSLSFYLEMPPAFHAWADLESYQYAAMQEDIKELTGEIREKGKAKPVVIAEKKYAAYGPVEAGQTEVSEVSETLDLKWRLVREFMGKFGYEKTYENEKFVIWQAE